MTAPAKTNAEKIAVLRQLFLNQAIAVTETVQRAHLPNGSVTKVADYQMDKSDAVIKRLETRAAKEGLFLCIWLGRAGRMDHYNPNRLNVDISKNRSRRWVIKNLAIG